MNLTREQIQKYWASKLDGQRVNWGASKVAVRCIFPDHDDSRPSATLFLDGNSGYNCSACGKRGNAFQVESLLSKCDLNQAETIVAKITGATPQVSNGWRLTASYDYRETDGKCLYQKRRLQHETEGKTFRVYRQSDRGFEMGIDPPTGKTRRVLYNLPDVITANVVCVAEGEKDCDTLASLNLYPDTPHLRVATTCNFDGAWQPSHSPKWLDEYSPYFAGKWVFIFVDNDLPGKTWATHIAQSVSRYATGVKLIELPGLPERGDVSDWMLTHTADDLRSEIKKTPKWEAPKEEFHQRLFISGSDFLAAADEEIEWWVDGVIQKNSNGLVVADPGAGKSFVTADLCICLALGIPWMGKNIPEPIRVGICAREDNPALTKWRLRHILMGKSGDIGLFQKNLWLNTRQQTGTLLLNDESQVQELISAIRERELQLVFMDVFSKLHSINENKSEEMGPLVETLSRIQRESGAAIGIVHHKNKLKEGTITQRTRGSSVLNGWAEWIIGLEMTDAEFKTRALSFEKIKAGEEGKPVSFCIDSNSHPGVVEMRLVQTTVVDVPKKRDYRSRQAGDSE